METMCITIKNQLEERVISHNNHPPPLYMDLDFSWNDDESLDFKSQQNLIQKLKYLNKGNKKLKSNLQYSLKGIFNQLSKLNPGTDKILK